MLRNGIPEEVTVALRSVSRSFRGWGSHVAVTRPLEDGEEIELPRPHPAGDAPPRPQPLGHRLLGRGAQDPDRRRPPARPHLLQPADLAARSTAPRNGPRRSSPTSSRCARRGRCRPRSSSPGHGEPVVDHVALIDERLAKHERRKEKIYKLIAEQPRTGYELAQAIWGNVAVTQAFLTLSEVIGHADLLVNEGRVREADDGTVVRYETTG